jgi:hypothetical protein
MPPNGLSFPLISLQTSFSRSKYDPPIIDISSMTSSWQLKTRFLASLFFLIFLSVSCTVCFGYSTPIPQNEWMVRPPIRYAETPVVLVTSNLRESSSCFCTAEISVLLPVPPCDKIEMFLPCLIRVVKEINSSDIFLFHLFHLFLYFYFIFM